MSQWHYIDSDHKSFVANIFSEKHLPERQSLEILHAQTNQTNECDVIHIALITVDIIQVKNGVNLLSSILYHRPTGRLHLHLAVTELTRHIWSTLLTSWELTHVAATYHIISDEAIGTLIEAILVPKYILLHDKDIFTGNIENIWNHGEVLSGKNIDHISSTLSSCGFAVIDKNVKADSDEPGCPYKENIIYFPGDFANGIQHLSQNATDAAFSADEFGHSKLHCSLREGHSVLELKTDDPEEKRMCWDVYKITHGRRRTHLYFLGSVYKPKDDIDITLLTVFTIQRLAIFERLVHSWDGPVHGVFYGTDEDVMNLENWWRNSGMHTLAHRISIHAVYKREFIFPINYLRNVAVNASTTAFHLMDDVDILPSSHLYHKLRTYIRISLCGEQYKVLVVPLFGTRDASFQLCDKSELVKFIMNQTVYGYKTTKGWAMGHKATDFPKWIVSKEPYQVVPLGGFEPYVVIQKSLSPLYDERFMYRFTDKARFLGELHALGFKFWVLPDVYLIHMPHETANKESTYFRVSMVLNRCKLFYRDKKIEELEAARQKLIESKQYNKRLEQTEFYINNISESNISDKLEPAT